MKRRACIATIISGLLICFFIPYHKVRSYFHRLKRHSKPDEHELKTAACISEHIYPEDDSPGAMSLRIHNFFSMQFKTAYYKKYVSSVQHITGYLDRESCKKGGKDFLSSEKMDQNLLIESIASGKADRMQPGIQKDFHKLINMTLEGCFSDPMHGGNKDKKAWNILKGSIKEEWFDV